NMIRNFYDEPSIFENHIREYADFIRDFMSMIYIPSIDGETPIPSVSISPVSYQVMSSDKASIPREKNKKNIEEPVDLNLDGTDEFMDEEKLKEFNEMIGGNIDYVHKETKEELQLREDVAEFISKSSTISNFLSENRQNDLIKFVVHLIMTRGIKFFQTDKFWEAAWNYSRQSRLIDTDIKRIIFSPFSFRYGSNVVFQDTAIYTPKQIQAWEKYLLAGDIYQYMEFWFPELSTFYAKNDYQLRLLTGLVLSSIKIAGKQSLLLNEDEFLAKPNLKKSKKTWREYLAEYTLNWLRMANRLGFEKYPSKRKGGDFYK
ncbi:MAG: hypothetical protein IT258_13665, partial [Saprospiraceae bacterium]|nr:hypothetical protein [Saprospiraceae bacterium]